MVGGQTLGSKEVYVNADAMCRWDVRI